MKDSILTNIILFMALLTLYGVYEKKLAKKDDIIKTEKALRVKAEQNRSVCDSVYKENYRILDSVVKSNATIQQRVLNHLHAEKRYRKGELRQY